MTSARELPLDEAALREAHTTLTRILGAIEEYVYTGEFMPDGGYRILFAGPCREQFLGLSTEEARTAIWRYYVHPDDLALFAEAHDGALTEGRIDLEYRIVGADGVLRWVRDRGVVRHEDGRWFLDGSILDVTEIHEMQEQLMAARAEADRMAHVDYLTGVENRRSLQPVLDSHQGRSTGLVVLDLDRFKEVNDRHGHAAGDAVLIAVAERLRQVVRSTDAILRMGGEEFLVVVHDVTDVAQLSLLAEKIRRRVAEESIDVGEAAITVTASVGAVVLPADAGDSDGYLRAADRALYAAKDAGRDRVVFASTDEPALQAAV
jgi:diguanylate cyclase (GGDEF)-like protein/PAS domain S-box-containing protein